VPPEAVSGGRKFHFVGTQEAIDQSSRRIEVHEESQGFPAFVLDGDLSGSAFADRLPADTCHVFTRSHRCLRQVMRLVEWSGTRATKVSVAAAMGTVFLG
jgi:hypothetical protein